MEKLRVSTQEVDTRNILGIRVISNIVVTITTKNINFAGTDANVFLNLGSLGNYPLITLGEDDFEIGSTNSYILDTNFPLISLRSEVIEIGHDNTGKFPGWNVSDLKIEVKFAGSNMLALYKEWREIGWLSIDEPPYNTTIAELQSV